MARILTPQAGALAGINVRRDLILTPVAGSVRWITEFCVANATLAAVSATRIWRFAYLTRTKRIPAALKTPSEFGLKIVLYGEPRAMRINTC